MTRSTVAMRAKARALEVQVSRYRGDDDRDDDRDDGACNEGREDDRADVTSLIIEAYEAVTSLEDDLEILRERLSPVMDPIGKTGEEEKDSDDAIAPAIAKLEQLVRRIADAGRAIRFLTRHARI